jgi:hypothetical protein
MNKSNVEYLQRSLKYLGFGTALNEVLEKNLVEGKEKFAIATSAQFDNKHSLKDKEYPKDTINYELHFSKSEKSDNYFFNNYAATLEKGGTNETLRQTFYLNRGNDITAKEAYNLLSGRSISKTVEISPKYDLNYIDDQGRLTSSLKVAGTQEAKNAISRDLESKRFPAGHYELLDKGYPIRNYNLDGKDFTSEPDGKVLLVHEYKDNKEDDTKRNSQSMANIGNAIKKIDKLRDSNNPDKENLAFKIYNDSGNKLLFQFDKGGKEVDIEPDKRKENIWIKLDFENQNSKGGYQFKKFYPNYGFDLDKTLQSLPIAEMKEEQQRDRLLGSLKRGNLQLVNLEREDTKKSLYIAANPQFKKLDVYDREMREVYQNRKEDQEKVAEEDISAGRGR